MKISYAITVKDEEVEIQKLLGFLLEKKRQEDEIVILFDSKNGTSKVREILSSYSLLGWYGWYERDFNDDFADHKNHFTALCTGDYIFQIDADELPSETLIGILPELLESNPNNEVYLVPRVNTVEGLTEEHIQRWRWNLNTKGWVNWPDYQWRIYKNIPTIKWINRVHEKLDGFTTYAAIPLEGQFEGCYLIHPKTIERQERQNNYYNTL
jgi:hypothetical protein